MPWLARHQPVIDFRGRRLVSTNTATTQDGHDPVPRPSKDWVHVRVEGPCCPSDVAKRDDRDVGALENIQVDSPAPETPSQAACVETRSSNALRGILKGSGGRADSSCATTGVDADRTATMKKGSRSKRVRFLGEEPIGKEDHQSDDSAVIQFKNGVFTECDDSPVDRGVTWEQVNMVVHHRGDHQSQRRVPVERPPLNVEDILALPVMSVRTLRKQLKSEPIEQICMIVPKDLASSSTVDPDVSDPSARIQRYQAQSWDTLRFSGNPAYPLVKQYADCFPDKVPESLSADRGVRHEIDLEPGTKYCVTRQWPLPREQVEAIDAFFASRHRAGHVRESKSPPSSPTFCVKKATGGWRVVYAFNMLNDASIPAQTPVPRKDMILDGMSGSTIFSALDVMDGFYQISMREQDVPLTAVSTPRGMMWEWLVMPQGLQNAPAAFNRMISQVLRPLRAFAPSYFDDIFVHSSAQGGKSATEVHLKHLRQVFKAMRKNRLYANHILRS
ncbi:TPA: hypothetical protein N0F65_000323 [Lagenidium giganteum]|uniref:Reverse transcriptase domain-containing protein n=1 Tax=Lagenidium giganteum TaxID=4803 RepID=A0AAV2YK05_9STRA|nr:TPA: hypothetical protein N0F65_000323 [Lagenidium giganteum]